MKNGLLLLFIIFILFSAFRADKPVLTISTIGDPTMVNKNLYGRNPECGWCMVLPGFFSEDVRVDNHAANGRNSKSFISEGRWAKVISQVEERDYVFIQFRHNDEKADSVRHTDPGTTFGDNLRRSVNEVRAKGGIPALFSSVVRRNFAQPGNASIATDAHHAPGEQGLSKGGNISYDAHGTYPGSPRSVAKEMEVASIDINKVTHDLVQGLGPAESKRLFMFVEPEKVPAFPKGREDNTHLNACGARTIAGLTIDAIAEGIPELAKYIRHYDYIATQDGTDDFFTVQEAINAVPDFRKNVRTTTLVRKGTYKEKIITPESKIDVSLIGEDGVVPTNDDFANKKNVFDKNMGTSGSLSCYIHAPGFYAENITFENSARPIGQAVACFVSADRAFFRNCRFLSYQGTLYMYGKHDRQYYEDCYTEETVDFIFRQSVAVFNHCHIHSRRDGYVTAPSTDQGKRYEYVFYDHRLTADPSAAKIYLSRPWRPYTQAVLIHCELGKRIPPEGWHNWGKKEAKKTVFCTECDSRGEGANPKAHAAFSHQLKNLKGYEMETVLTGGGGWNPLKNDSAK